MLYDLKRLRRWDIQWVISDKAVRSALSKQQLGSLFYILLVTSSVSASLNEQLGFCCAEIVDTVMNDDDIDDDGYLTYPEYITARRRAEAEEEQRDSSSSDSSRRRR